MSDDFDLEDYYPTDDDVPWADPAIREAYEAALGRLILAFNEVDFHLTQVIKCAIEKLGGAEPLRRLAKGTFAQRVDNFAVLAALPHDLPMGDIDCDELRRLNGFRNIVAHGHFDQNPFDGSYDLIGARNGYAQQVRHTEREFPATRLDEITADLTAVRSKLGYIEMHYRFDPIVAKLVETEKAEDGEP